jgi:hypothetical protein
MKQRGLLQNPFSLRNVPGRNEAEPFARDWLDAVAQRCFSGSSHVLI